MCDVFFLFIHTHCLENDKAKFDDACNDNYNVFNLQISIKPSFSNLFLFISVQNQYKNL